MTAAASLAIFAQVILTSVWIPALVDKDKNRLEIGIALAAITVLIYMLASMSGDRQ